VLTTGSSDSRTGNLYLTLLLALLLLLMLPKPVLRAAGELGCDLLLMLRGDDTVAFLLLLLLPPLLLLMLLLVADKLRSSYTDASIQGCYTSNVSTRSCYCYGSTLAVNADNSTQS
jgi:hypothetical protein